MCALVIITGPEWQGHEIMISGRDPAARRGVPVRRRRGEDGLRYTAVFPALPAGAYTIWRDRESAGTVVVAAASVTELEWWAPPPPDLR